MIVLEQLSGGRRWSACWGADAKVCHTVVMSNLNNPCEAPAVCSSLFGVLRGHRDELGMSPGTDGEEGA